MAERTLIGDRRITGDLIVEGGVNAGGVNSFPTLSGSGAPAVNPSGIGQFYIDLSNNTLYMAVDDTGTPSVDWKTNGSQVGIWSRTTTVLSPTTSGDVVRFSNGSASVPSVSFVNDIDTGTYLQSDGFMSFATAGTFRLGVSTVDIQASLPIQGPSGSAPAPSFSFTGDTDTGMYLSTTGVLGFATAGVNRITISSTQATFNQNILVNGDEFFDGVVSIGKTLDEAFWAAAIDPTVKYTTSTTTPQTNTMFTAIWNNTYYMEVIVVAGKESISTPANDTAFAHYRLLIAGGIATATIVTSTLIAADVNSIIAGSDGTPTISFDVSGNNIRITTTAAGTAPMTWHVYTLRYASANFIL